MILLTVGTQLPFDRLVEPVDRWAAEHAKEPVKAQIGPSTYHPKAMDCFSFIAPEKCRELQRSARVIIAHAGMGTIVTAMEFGVPIIIMPRRAKHGEHRNDHQLATVKQFSNTPGVYVVHDEHELLERLAQIDALEGAKSISSNASSELIDKLRGFIDGLPRHTRHA